MNLGTEKGHLELWDSGVEEGPLEDMWGVSDRGFGDGEGTI